MKIVPIKEWFSLLKPNKIPNKIIPLTILDNEVLQKLQQQGVTTGETHYVNVEEKVSDEQNV